MRRRVEGDNVDVIFEMLQKLVELLRAADAVGEDLRLVGHPLGWPRLNVPQVDMPLLREEDDKEETEEQSRGCDSPKRWKEEEFVQLDSPERVEEI